MTSRARSGLVLLAVIAIAALPAASAAAQGPSSETPSSQGTLLAAPAVQRNLPRITPREAVQIANRTPEVRGELSRHPDLHPDNITLFKGSGNWDISYLSGSQKLADVTIDGHTGRVIEAWKGTQAAWVMARGHHGYFGK